MTSKLLSLRAEPAAPLLPTHSQPSSTDSSDTTLSEDALMNRCSEALNKILETLDLVSTRGPLDDADQVDEFEKLVDQQESLEELITDRRDRSRRNDSEVPEEVCNDMVEDVERLRCRVDAFTKRIRRTRMKRSIGCIVLREASERLESGSIHVVGGVQVQAKEQHEAMYSLEVAIRDEAPLRIVQDQETVEGGRFAAETVRGRRHSPMVLVADEHIDKNCDQWGDPEDELK
ncbi:hypothetical protein AAF712_008905 [Marasmius tenuissimus]|uniref:Uncharacterized protein n=1 Tax=Marasmius tenuissimus TaxID=585030 RepID=A0ABR2ZS30_9AGAR